LSLLQLLLLLLLLSNLPCVCAAFIPSFPNSCSLCHTSLSAGRATAKHLSSRPAAAAAVLRVCASAVHLEQWQLSAIAG
jgi:hypothetical protein